MRVAQAQTASLLRVLMESVWEGVTDINYHQANVSGWLKTQWTSASSGVLSFWADHHQAWQSRSEHKHASTRSVEIEWSPYNGNMGSTTIEAVVWRQSAEAWRKHQASVCEQLRLWPSKTVCGPSDRWNKMGHAFYIWLKTSKQSQAILKSIVLVCMLQWNTLFSAHTITSVKLGVLLLCVMTVLPSTKTQKKMAPTTEQLFFPQVRGHSSVTSATPPSREKTRSMSTSRWCTTDTRSTSATCARRPLSLRLSSRATRRWMKDGPKRLHFCGCFEIEFKQICGWKRLMKACRTTAWFSDHFQVKVSLGATSLLNLKAFSFQQSRKCLLLLFMYH